MRHKRLLAMAAAILLLLLYASTIVFALMDSPLSQSLLMASLFFFEAACFSLFI